MKIAPIIINETIVVCRITGKILLKGVTAVE